MWAASARRAAILAEAVQPPDLFDEADAGRAQVTKRPLHQLAAGAQLAQGFGRRKPGQQRPEKIGVPDGRVFGGLKIAARHRSA